jgi:chemotaxis response regulator CheB
MAFVKKIRVLIVDDSATIRQAMKEILESDPRIEVMAVAPDPYVAVERIKSEVPDVITLDVEMPRMDGLTFLDRIMSQHPIPVVICSSLTVKGPMLPWRRSNEVLSRSSQNQNWERGRFLKNIACGFAISSAQLRRLET